MSNSRREFIKLMSAGAMLAPLTVFYNRPSVGAPSFGPGFGSLTPALPLNTSELFAYRVDDPASLAFDFRNIPIISLPPEFRYWAVSWTGQRMSDGSIVPGDQDGMAAYRGLNGTTILVRNHELSNRENKFGNLEGVLVPSELKYDTWCNGGTTTLVLNSDGMLMRDFASLGGTNNNCAGGLTPWGTWLTCEESTSLPTGSEMGYQKPHGYVFEVPTFVNAPVQAVPIVAMGRFNHEATATDPRTGIVYQTEDVGDSLFYRYVPNIKGELLAGGKLQALKLKNFSDVTNTRTGFLELKGVPLACEWVTIDNPDPADNAFDNSTRVQGQAKGATIFSRGEGAWYGNDLIYFCCSNGGNLGAGQIWAYHPATETLTLVVESESRDGLDAPDNITVGPDGRIYMFEDGSGGDNIVGVNSEGELFRMAENLVNTAEFCGGCFSHNGRFMFVNIQNPGMTLVIEGPWRKGQA